MTTKNNAKRSINTPRLRNIDDNLSKRYGNWALVTGATSGIGAAMSRRLAAQGVNVVAVARNSRRLDALAEELSTTYNVEVQTIALDVSAPGAVKQLDDATAHLDVGIVIPNAGMETSGEFVQGDLALHTKLVSLNAVAPMELAHTFGQRLVARKRGAILFISSTFGYQGIPLLANYAASKAYILALGEALNVELKPHGVDVSVLAPGLTRTAMSAAMPFDFSKLPVVTQSPETVAKTGLRILGRKATAISGWLSTIMTWSNRFIPRSWPVNLFGFLLKRARRVDTPEQQSKDSREIDALKFAASHPFQH